MEEIRAADAACGPVMQMFPLAWTHRRDLLAHIEQLEQTLDELAYQLAEARKAPAVSYAVELTPVGTP